MACCVCAGTGAARLTVWRRRYWIDLTLASSLPGRWRLRVVGRERIDFESVNLRWHDLGDLWLGRSRDTWPDLDVVKGVAKGVAHELRKNARR